MIVLFVLAQAVTPPPVVVLPCGWEPAGAALCLDVTGKAVTPPPPPPVDTSDANPLWPYFYDLDQFFCDDTPDLDPVRCGLAKPKDSQ